MLWMCCTKCHSGTPRHLLRSPNQHQCAWNSSHPQMPQIVKFCPQAPHKTPSCANEKLTFGDPDTGQLPVVWRHSCSWAHLLAPWRHSKTKKVPLDKSPHSHLQHSFLVCLYSGWPCVAALRQLEPKELIQGINQHQDVPWIHSLGFNWLRTVIWGPLGV